MGGYRSEKGGGVQGGFAVMDWVVLQLAMGVFLVWLVIHKV